MPNFLRYFRKLFLLIPRNAAASPLDLAAEFAYIKMASFVISGIFKNHSRDELKSLIDQNGGKNTSSISKKTSYLIAGENMGPSKREKAEMLGVPIISEDEFLSLLQ